MAINRKSREVCLPDNWQFVWSLEWHRSQNVNNEPNGLLCFAWYSLSGFLFFSIPAFSITEKLYFVIFVQIESVKWEYKQNF